MQQSTNSEKEGYYTYKSFPVLSKALSYQSSSTIAVSYSPVPTYKGSDSSEGPNGGGEKILIESSTVLNSEKDFSKFDLFFVLNYLFSNPNPRRSQLTGVMKHRERYKSMDQHGTTAQWASRFQDLEEDQIQWVLDWTKWKTPAPNGPPIELNKRKANVTFHILLRASNASGFAPIEEGVLDNWTKKYLPIKREFR
ncbi:hypothetical protein ACH5RR_033326 [Cinchona calisaya]|uniref:Uncharacterized protein n=1 Tax=Cinchona calisaya TaxID=153742 RepID=A0ABD2YKM4_9GENT